MLLVPVISLPSLFETKNITTPANESEVIAVADTFAELEAQVKKALLTKTDLGGLAEWIDVYSIEGDAYAVLPDGPVDTKRVPIHYSYDLTTRQLSYRI